MTPVIEGSVHSQWWLQVKPQPTKKLAQGQWRAHSATGDGSLASARPHSLQTVKCQRFLLAQMAEEESHKDLIHRQEKPQT